MAWKGAYAADAFDRGGGLPLQRGDYGEEIVFTFQVQLTPIEAAWGRPYQGCEADKEGHEQVEGLADRAAAGVMDAPRWGAGGVPEIRLV